MYLRIFSETSYPQTFVLSNFLNCTFVKSSPQKTSRTFDLANIFPKEVCKVINRLCFEIVNGVFEVKNRNNYPKEHATFTTPSAGMIFEGESFINFGLRYRS